MAMRDKIEHAIQNQPCTVKDLKNKFGGDRGADRKVMEAVDQLVHEAVICQRQGVFFTVRSGRADKALLCKVVKLGKLNPNVPCFPNYGGRGITVCAEWAESFEPFRDWALANGYWDNLTIDRIDVNSNYCPDNCRWVSMKTQCENRSNNNLLKLDGETQPVSVWAERIGVSADLLYSRKRKGWTDERILKTPSRKKKGI